MTYEGRVHSPGKITIDRQVLHVPAEPPSYGGAPHRCPAPVSARYGQAGEFHRDGFDPAGTRCQ
ncbi:hypothetical protein GCM10020254_79030 [Streptomyces goshikiensis]